MSDTVIRVENLGKKYILGHQKQKDYTTLRDTISNGAKGLLKPFQRSKSQQTDPSSEEFWALKDVSFEIKQGDRIGIIGRNGAGKSTLLKILSRITEPTKGSIRIKGRVASLLEVGTGFHPELTGRENISLNGAILGMSKTEIVRKFDEIVAFAEVEKFLDTPVKRYSSGMYVRLAFSVAAHLEPEILIVDEVLAVGDAQFQKKCLGKMKNVAGEGRTVLFVSHNMAAINTLCTNGIVLNRGQVLCAGEINKCIEAYESKNSQMQGYSWVRPKNLENRILEIQSIDIDLVGSQPDLSLKLEVNLQSRSEHKSAFIAIDILDARGTGIMQALPTINGFIEFKESPQKVNINIEMPPLIPGRYLLTLWVGSHNSATLDEVKEVVAFEIYDSPTPGRSFSHTIDHGHIVPFSSITVA
jgi:lipopolysaccharide transport system ATP-binding protein